MTTLLEVEQTIREAFEANYEQLRAESGHALSPDVREAALQEVLLYWRKLHELAEKITETEVRLNLPNQKTPNGRKFGIEGVVDIVREHDRTTMYDIKTHDPEFIAANKDFYQQQLNVYAYIWENLRGQGLDETAIISTHVPLHVREMLQGSDPAKREKALEEWSPVIPIPFDPQKVGDTIQDFGGVVDGIESGSFSPPPTTTLNKRQYGKKTFGARVCGNCDLRFSCRSYRDYAKSQTPRGGRRSMDYYEIFSDELDREMWRGTTPGGEEGE
jgi:hypothetical protein